ncbi:aldo/keto reductase [Candidatus Geothermarchaeota archaeon]|nr:MAG: aldo/keto reductase [Candidatus Geothermarchaeota archaeon]
MYIDYRDKKEIGNTGEFVSAIGLGTWRIKDYDTAYKTFLHAFESGIDNVDTAEIYDNGRAEEFVGRVVKAFGRDNIFITTKLAPYSLSDKYSAVKAAENSLKRLGIKYVDLILIHWSEPSLNLVNQIRNLEYLITRGYTRYIGVSNFTVSELDIAIENLSKHDIVVNQVKYSILDKRVEREGLLDYCIRNKISIHAYTPLEGGLVAHNEILKQVGEKYNKSPIQIALNYLISHTRVIAIPKTENEEHLTEIINSMGWRLDQRDLDILSTIEDILY